ncbi:BHH_G0052760.mRNA.1.CDS.1 [Saccharomyces cerevisiae]|nr:BHH_G0052760.mRNA.1.CDS.1 [Saccharomyces cerevisiae]CAI7364315.1 BHH_G0052760.mRNA.1.CDS.1 [Saccharomyces cerevisiae]
MDNKDHVGNAMTVHIHGTSSDAKESLITVTGYSCAEWFLCHQSLGTEEIRVIMSICEQKFSGLLLFLFGVFSTIR